jgi:hypothetical protein
MEAMKAWWIPLIALLILGIGFGAGFAFGSRRPVMPPGCGRTVETVVRPASDGRALEEELDRMGVPAIQLTDREFAARARRAVLCLGSGHLVLLEPGPAAYLRVPDGVPALDRVQTWIP